MTNDINAPRYKELMRLRAHCDRAVALAYNRDHKDEIVAELDSISDEDIVRIVNEHIFKEKTE